MKDSVRVKANYMKDINDLTISESIVIFGSTYMSHFPLYEFINKCEFENAIYNRSIAGLTIEEASKIANDCVIAIHPCKIFLALGEEDETDPRAMEKYSALIAQLHSKLPECKLYLIGVTGESDYAHSFNQNAINQCDGKDIVYIEFTENSTSEKALHKARFKQLSCFFRSNPITMSEAFSISNV